MHINHNNRPCRFKTNFWKDLFRLLKSYRQKFYLIVGDLVTDKHLIATFFDEIKDIALKASGKRGAKNEIFLGVNVYSENVFFELITVDYGASIGMTEEYHTKNLLKIF